MMRFARLIVAFFTVAVVAIGCGGKNKDDTVSFNVAISDAGAGFTNAGQTNLVVLGTANGVYRAEVVRAIYGADIKNESSASFAWALGAPTNVESSGVGVFEFRVTQGVAGTWKSGDSYDGWKVNGHNYAAGYGPKESNYPGWSVWDATTTTYIGPLAGMAVNIRTYFLNRTRSVSLAAKPSDDSGSISDQTAKIVAKYRFGPN